jgi:hypothetical protein
MAIQAIDAGVEQASDERCNALPVQALAACALESTEPGK